MKNLKGSAVNKIIKNTKKNVETFYNVFKIFFALKKLKKHPQKLSRKTQVHFFSLLHWAAQTAQTEECSELWLIDQLYIELGSFHHQYLVQLIRTINTKSEFWANIVKVKSVQWTSKCTKKCQYIYLNVKMKTLCKTINSENWNSVFVKLVVWWAERDKH